MLTLAPSAEEHARHAEAVVLRGDTIGPLHGVPFTAKDSLDTAGVRTTRGSQLFGDHIPASDATVVARLKRAGAVLLAKTNVPESIVRGREEALHPATRRFLEIPVPTLGEYTAGVRELEQLRDEIAAYFCDHDVLLCPVSPVAAFPHEARQVIVGEATLPALHVVRPAAPFNVTGSPALSVPFGWTKEGLPIGVQLVGRYADEAAESFKASDAQGDRVLEFGLPLQIVWK